MVDEIVITKNSLFLHTCPGVDTLLSSLCMRSQTDTTIRWLQCLTPVLFLFSLHLVANKGLSLLWMTKDRHQFVLSIKGGDKAYEINSIHISIFSFFLPSSSSTTPIPPLTRNSYSIQSLHTIHSNSKQARKEHKVNKANMHKSIVMEDELVPPNSTKPLGHPLRT